MPSSSHQKNVGKKSGIVQLSPYRLMTELREIIPAALLKWPCNFKSLNTLLIVLNVEVSSGLNRPSHLVSNIWQLRLKTEPSEKPK